jgi:hypothetical protein
MLTVAKLGLGIMIKKVHNFGLLYPAEDREVGSLFSYQWGDGAMGRIK